MHIQVINFNLEGISRAEYEAVCDELAGAFAQLPGLISKHWLADEENNKIHLIDWKTCSWGWNSKKKSDTLIAQQLIFYKYLHFFMLLLLHFRNFCG